MNTYGKEYIRENLIMRLKISDETVEKILTAIASDETYLKEIEIKKELERRAFLAGYEFVIDSYDGQDLNELGGVIHEQDVIEPVEYNLAVSKLLEELKNCGLYEYCDTSDCFNQLISIPFEPAFCVNIDLILQEDIEKKLEEIKDYIELHTQAKVCWAKPIIRKYGSREYEDIVNKIDKMNACNKLMQALGIKRQIA